MIEVVFVKFIRRFRFSELCIGRNYVIVNIWKYIVRSFEYYGLRFLILFGSIIVYVL